MPIRLHLIGRALCVQGKNPVLFIDSNHMIIPLCQMRITRFPGGAVFILDIVCDFTAGFKSKIEKGETFFHRLKNSVQHIWGAAEKHEKTFD